MGCEKETKKANQFCQNLGSEINEEASPLIKEMLISPYEFLKGHVEIQKYQVKILENQFENKILEYKKETTKRLMQEDPLSDDYINKKKIIDKNFQQLVQTLKAETEENISKIKQVFSLPSDFREKILIKNREEIQGFAEKNKTYVRNIRIACPPEEFPEKNRQTNKNFQEIKVEYLTSFQEIIDKVEQESLDNSVANILENLKMVKNNIEKKLFEKELPEYYQEGLITLSQKATEEFEKTKECILEEIEQGFFSKTPGQLTSLLELVESLKSEVFYKVNQDFTAQLDSVFAPANYLEFFVQEKSGQPQNDEVDLAESLFSATKTKIISIEKSLSPSMKTLIQEYVSLNKDLRKRIERENFFSIDKTTISIEKLWQELLSQQDTIIKRIELEKSFLAHNQEYKNEDKTASLFKL